MSHCKQDPSHRAGTVSEIEEGSKLIARQKSPRNDQIYRRPQMTTSWEGSFKHNYLPMA